MLALHFSGVATGFACITANVGGQSRQRLTKTSARPFSQRRTHQIQIYRFKQRREVRAEGFVQQKNCPRPASRAPRIDLPLPSPFRSQRRSLGVVRGMGRLTAGVGCDRCGFRSSRGLRTDPYPPGPCIGRSAVRPRDVPIWLSKSGGPPPRGGFVRPPEGGGRRGVRPRFNQGNYTKTLRRCQAKLYRKKGLSSQGVGGVDRIRNRPGGGCGCRQKDRQDGRRGAPGAPGAPEGSEGVGGGRRGRRGRQGRQRGRKGSEGGSGGRLEGSEGSEDD